MSHAEINMCVKDIKDSESPALSHSAGTKLDFEEKNIKN